MPLSQPMKLTIPNINLMPYVQFFLINKHDFNGRTFTTLCRIEVDSFPSQFYSGIFAKTHNLSEEQFRLSG